MPSGEAERSQCLELEYRTGDIFDSVPYGAVLIHACNCRGVWGAGIAKSFRKRYKDAYEIYREACAEVDASELLGQALVIPVGHGREAHYVACLFTRVEYGAQFRNAQDQEDATRECLEATASAMASLLGGWKDVTKDDFQQAEHELRMPKINSGKFRVPWDRTAQVLCNMKLPAAPKAQVVVRFVVYAR